MTQPWSEFHKRWFKLQPPQRVTDEVAARFAAAVARHDDHVLLLGVTPQLAGIGRKLTAADRSENMIASVWPGDDARRQVVKTDWRDMTFAGRPFSAVIGDGSFNCLDYPNDYRTVLARLGNALSAGAQFAVRFFMTPAHCESLDALAQKTRSGDVESVHALKWRLAMADVTERGDPNIAVARIRDLFNTLFPDRTALARQTGWSAEDITTIDNYRESPDRLSFPTEAQLRAVIPPAFCDLRLVASGRYDLAERCPIATMTFAG